MTSAPKTGSFPIREGSRLFGHIFPFLILYDCIRISVAHTVKGAETAKLGDVGLAQANQFALHVKHPTGGLLKAALESDATIPGFHLDVERTIDVPGSFRTTALQDIITNTISPIFVNYFENQRPWLDANVSKDFYQWPTGWNFARVVRNAASHGGICSWQDKKAPPVSWHHVTYSAKDHGRRIMGGDLVLGDLLLLMLEMDSGYLEKLLSVPIADRLRVNVKESEGERSGIIRRQDRP